MTHPVIVYIPGLLPKPEPVTHRDALLRCLLAGIERIDAPVAEAIAGRDEHFRLVSWTYDFYGVHRDFALDRASVEAVIDQKKAGERDIAEATAWTRRLTRWIYHLGDRMPFLIPHLASERMEVHLRDLMSYERNKDGAADRVRRLLRDALENAATGHHPLLLVGHSMGSVIAYDTLWELTHEYGDAIKIDMLLTMGSPLGQRFMQKRIKGHDRSGADRFPHGVKRWMNLAAVGDLTAIDPALINAFREMLELKLVDEIVDTTFFNYFRLGGELNVHSEYGYLVNEAAARTVREWWRSVS